MISGLVVMELFKCKHSNSENLALGETLLHLLTFHFGREDLVRSIHCSEKKPGSTCGNTCMTYQRGGWRISHRVPGTLQILICRDFLEFTYFKSAIELKP